jgi:hypothetical protein
VNGPVSAFTIRIPVPRDITTGEPLLTVRGKEIAEDEWVSGLLRAASGGIAATEPVITLVALGVWA